MEQQVLRDLSYGMYIVSCKDDKNVGCVVNTVVQITSKNPTIMVSINHDNYTNKCIQDTGRFAISILGEHSDPGIIGVFGFKSGRDHNKFDEYLVQVEHDFAGLRKQVKRVISSDFLRLENGGAFHNGDYVVQELMDLVRIKTR